MCVRVCGYVRIFVFASVYDRLHAMCVSTGNTSEDPEAALASAHRLVPALALDAPTGPPCPPEVCERGHSIL